MQYKSFSKDYEADEFEYCFRFNYDEGSLFVGYNSVDDNKIPRNYIDGSVTQKYLNLLM